VNRYVIEVEGGIEIIAEVSTAEYSTGFRVGERVSAFLDDVHMLLFDYPAEGLEKEISLE
jgi:retron-type reverse transcriptase